MSAVRSPPRSRAALIKPSVSSTPWLLASMAFMFCFESGSSRITVTLPSGETSFNASLSFAANQSAHRQDSRKDGQSKRFSLFRISSSGVRPSSVPAPRLVEPIQKERCVMPLRLVVEGQKVPDCDVHTPLPCCLGLECRCLAGTRFGDQHIRRGVGIVAQRRRSRFRATRFLAFVDYRACPRGYVCHCCVHSAARITTVTV